MGNILCKGGIFCINGRYLDKLIARKNNGMIKVITGVRRCGKSFILFKLYKKYLNSLGIDDSHIIQISLEDIENFSFHNPLTLDAYIKKMITDKKQYYLFWTKYSL